MTISDIGILHSGQDREIAASIAAHLRRSGLDVWIDPIPLVLGRTPSASVEAIVAQSRVLLIVCSSALQASNWLMDEGRVLRQSLAQRSDAWPILIIVEDVKDLPPVRMSDHPIDLTRGSFDENLAELALKLDHRLRKKTVFVCHSSRDKGRVRRIVKALRRRRHLAVWFDEKDLLPGSVIRRRLEWEISRADYLLAVLSHNAIDTLEGWIGFELDQAYERERSRNLNGHYFAVPVTIDEGLLIPGWLSTKVHVDLTKGFARGIESIVAAVSANVPPE